jgi:hypothetical protein
MPQIKIEFKGNLHCGGIGGILGDKKDFKYSLNVDRILAVSITTIIDGSPILGNRADATIINDWITDGYINVHAWVDAGNNISWIVHVDCWLDIKNDFFISNNNVGINNC